MKRLLLLTLFFSLISCLPQEEGYKLSETSSRVPNALEADDDHDDPSGTVSGNNLILSGTPVLKAEILETVGQDIKLIASPEFSGGLVQLSIDTSELAPEIANSFKMNFINSSVQLSAGEETTLRVQMKSSPYGTAFKGMSEGGPGKVKLIATFGNERAELMASVGVEPVVTVSFVAPQVFRVGSELISDDQVINIGSFGEGVELVSHYEQDFGQEYRDATDDPGPCLHIVRGAGLNHCNTAQDLPTVGSKFSHGRVLPGVDKSTVFYDHNMRGGFTATLRFNQPAPGVQ